MHYHKCVKFLTLLAAATVAMVPFCGTSPAQAENLQEENTSQGIVSVLPGEFQNINHFENYPKYPSTDQTVKQDRNYHAIESPQSYQPKGLTNAGGKYRARRSATGSMAMAAMAAKGGSWIKKFVAKTVIRQVVKNVVKSAFKRGGNKRNMGNGRGMRGMRGMNNMNGMSMGW